jgi:Coenzyme PQQ synthesis protein D (PqqD)
MGASSRVSRIVGSGASEEPEVFRPHPQVVARRVGDEMVVIQLDRNNIHALNRTGARFWELLVEGRSRSEACEQMLKEFDVPGSQLETEIDELLDLLLGEGLLLTGQE